MKNNLSREASLLHVILVLGFLIAMLALGIRVAGIPGYIPLILSSVLGILIGIYYLKFSFENIEKGILKTVQIVMPSVFILLSVGMLIPMWMASGFIPLVIYYGVQWINVKFFLVCCFLLCSIVSILIGSSWTTGATVGVALFGIGETFGIPSFYSAGAIISGSYVGDRISFTSNTTNLSAGASEVHLLSHLRHSLYTVIPAFILSLIFFTILGLFNPIKQTDTLSFHLLLESLDKTFNLNSFVLSAPIFLFVCIYFQIPTFLALIISSLYAALLVFFIQGLTLTQFFEFFTYGYHTESTTYLPMKNLVEKGGVTSMFDTLGLILCASLFGGVVESTGMLKTLSTAILKLLKTKSSVFLGTTLAGILFNAILGDQYLSVIMTARMFKDIFKVYRLDALNLSRLTGDTATLPSVFYPWNTCGAYFIGLLGISPWIYVPFCFFNLSSIVMTIFLGYTGLFVKKREETL